MATLPDRQFIFPPSTENPRLFATTVEKGIAAYVHFLTEVVTSSSPERVNTAVCGFNQVYHVAANLLGTAGAAASTGQTAETWRFNLASLAIADAGIDSLTVWNALDRAEAGASTGLFARLVFPPSQLPKRDLDNLEDCLAHAVEDLLRFFNCLVSSVTPGETPRLPYVRLDQARRYLASVDRDLEYLASHFRHPAQHAPDSFMYWSYNLYRIVLTELDFKPSH